MESQSDHVDIFLYSNSYNFNSWKLHRSLDNFRYFYHKLSSFFFIGIQKWLHIWYLFINILLWAAHSTMWSVTNYFLINVTIADLLMSTLNCIPSFIFMRDRSVALFSLNSSSSVCNFRGSHFFTKIWVMWVIWKILYFFKFWLIVE